MLTEDGCVALTLPDAGVAVNQLVLPLFAKGVTR